MTETPFSLGPFIRNEGFRWTGAFEQIIDIR